MRRGVVKYSEVVGLVYKRYGCIDCPNSYRCKYMDGEDEPVCSAVDFVDGINNVCKVVNG